MAYGQLFDVLTTDHGFSDEDAYVVMSAVAHTGLGGRPTRGIPIRSTPSGRSGR